MCLSELAKELLLEILECLNSADLKNLRLTSSRISACTDGILFNELYVELLHDFPPQGSLSSRRLSFLKAIARGKTHLGKHIRSLTMTTSYMVRKDQKNKTRCIRRVLSRLHLIPAPRPADLILDAAKSLTSVHEIRWRNGYLHCTSLETVVDLPKMLRTIAIYCPITRLHIENSAVPLPCFAMFPNIQDLFLAGSIPRESLLAIFPSSRLTVRKIDFGACVSPGDGSSTQSLFTIEDLFVHAKGGTLHSLFLAHVTFSLDTVPLVLSLIPNLTRLHFSYMTIPDKFWDQLRMADIHCTDLHLKNVDITDAAFLYIASYRGLVDLEISSTLAIGGGKVPSELGLRFWMEVLPRHAATLESLRVTPQVYVSPWCFSAKCIPALEQLRRLRYLNISPLKYIGHACPGGHYLRCLSDLMLKDVWPGLHRIWMSHSGSDIVDVLNRGEYERALMRCCSLHRGTF